MDKQQAIAWLLEADKLCGAGFHVDTPASEYDPPMPANFELARIEFLEQAQREGFDPYAFAMSVMPRFADTTRKYAI